MTTPASNTKEAKAHHSTAAQREVTAKLQALLQVAYAVGLPVTAAGIQRTLDAHGWELAGDKEQAHKALKKGR